MSVFYARNKAYRDVNEDQYMFNAFKNYPEHAKSQLSPSELQLLKNDSSIRTFVTHGSLDKKNLLLAKAGIQYVKIYVDLNNADPFPLKKFVKMAKTLSNSGKDRAALIKEIISHNLFATSSREILAAASLLAQGCHTEYYFVNADYNRMATAIEQVKMQNLLRYDGSRDNDKIIDAEKSRTDVGRFMLSVIEAENFLRVHLKLTWLDINILLFLFINRDTQTDGAAIYRNVFNYQAKAVQRRINTMVSENYISKMTMTKKTVYVIAELGIMRVTELLEKVTHKGLVT